MSLPPQSLVTTVILRLYFLALDFERSVSALKLKMNLGHRLCAHDLKLPWSAQAALTKYPGLAGSLLSVLEAGRADPGVGPSWLPSLSSHMGETEFWAPPLFIAILMTLSKPHFFPRPHPPLNIITQGFRDMCILRGHVQSITKLFVKAGHR